MSGASREEVISLSAVDVELPVITVAFLGGTIAMAHVDGNLVPALTSAEILATAPGLADVVRVRPLNFRSVPGAELRFEDVYELASAIKQCFQDGAAGVVVTQGTDTLEEVAFLLDLLISNDEPVVVTGALRHSEMNGFDGAANLVSAALVASSQSASGLGTVAVLNDQIHAARFVQKRHTSNVAAFESPMSGPIGWISEGRPIVLVRPPRIVPLSIPARQDVPAVALLPVTLGSDGRLIRALPKLGFEGAVIEGLGGGHVPAALVGDLAEVARVFPVVLASRTRSGHLLSRTYGFKGSEQDLLASGLTSSGYLDGIKARILLTVLLQLEHGREQIASSFDLYA